MSARKEPTVGPPALMAKAVETRFVTVTVVGPLSAPTAQVIVAAPAARGVTCPAELTVATPVAPLVQVHELVMFCFDESEYVPVAVSCNGLLPTLMLGLPGVTAMDCKVGGGPTKPPLKVASRPVHPELKFCVKVAA